MRPGGTALQLRVELTSDEPGMVRELDHLHEVFIWGCARHDQAVLLEQLTVFVVDLIPMAVSLADLARSVDVQDA